MPQKTVFIRDEDLGTWNSIEKKSEFLHEALNNHEITITPAEPRAMINQTAITGPAVQSAFEGRPIIRAPREKIVSQGLCKNGHLLQPGRTVCSTKGCKYS